MSIKSKNSTFNSKFLIFNCNVGLTLVETLVALTILAVGLLGVSLMQVTSVSGNFFSREMDVATELAQDMIERLKVSTYTSLVEDPILAAGDHTNAELEDASEPPQPQPNPIDARGLATLNGIEVPLRIYTRTWTVTNDGLGAGTNMKTFTVTVSWEDKERQRLRNQGFDAPNPQVRLAGVKIRE
jgi:type II secretory pathway pseudopilin PulG